MNVRRTGLVGAADAAFSEELGMAMTPGFTYDLFVSYAHADNLPVPGGSGWVTHFVTALESALKMRLGGGDDLKIFIDRSATGANDRIDELIAAARTSAMFLAIGSPSYAKRSWPKHELAAFTEEIPDPSRLFLIEFLPLNEGEHYPIGISRHIRTQLWRHAGDERVALPLSPVGDAATYDQRTHILAQRMRDKLLSLSLLPAAREPVSRSLTPLPVRKKTVLLAQVTGDIDDEADQLRTYLSQYSEQLIVLPIRDYPQGGDAFRAAFENDLAHADLFVQLLGRRPGLVPPDLPEGYTYCQMEAARRRGVEIVQWRRPDVDPASVTDEKYQAALTADTVVASGLEEFKRQVLDILRKPAPAPPPPPGQASIVFIDADDKDIPFAKEIEKECLQRALTTILPIAGKSSEATRRDLAANFTVSDALLFIYGDTTQDWIRSQLRFFSKIRQGRESLPKIAAIFAGPPSTQEDIGIHVPNVKRIECADWSIEPVRSLLSELVHDC